MWLLKLRKMWQVFFFAFSNCPWILIIKLEFVYRWRETIVKNVGHSMLIGRRGSFAMGLL